MGDNSGVASAVEDWVRAEYQFRFGPHRYTTEAQDWLLRAEKRLRRAVAGTGDLRDAYEALGGQPVPEDPPKRQPKPKGLGLF